MSSLNQVVFPTSILLSSSSPSVPAHQQRILPHHKNPCQSSSSLISSTPTKPSSEPRSKSSWIETLRSQARSGLVFDAVSTYISMTMADVAPDNFVFPAILKAAADLQDLDLGKQIHAHVVKFGYGSKYAAVDNTLVNMYGKCGDIGDANMVFDKMSERNQVSWNSMIAALCRHEEWNDALGAFRFMQMEHVEISSFALVSVLLACGSVPSGIGLRLGKQVHGYSLRKGDVATHLINALMSMYAKLGKLDYSRSLLNVFEDRD